MRGVRVSGTTVVDNSLLLLPVALGPARQLAAAFRQSVEPNPDGVEPGPGRAELPRILE